MQIAIAGGSGFLGRALSDALTRDGHCVTILTRKPPAAAGPSRDLQGVTWMPDGSVGAWAHAIDGTDAVVNLAGESIAEGRWTAARKARVLESRVRATQSLAQAAAAVARPPKVFVNGSAVGYYGPLGDEIVTEDHPSGADFLAQVCVAWEAEANAAASATTRVACLRTGLVLGRQGGALPRILLPFRFGAGGRVGSGRQYWPWIHLDDWVALVRFVIETPGAVGPINLTAPNPVTNTEFTRALGRVMRRPALMPAPAFALRLALGEMADALLLSGQRAVPAKAERLGFQFKHREIGNALQALLER